MRTLYADNVDNGTAAAVSVGLWPDGTPTTLEGAAD